MKVLNENFEYNTDGWDDGNGITTGEAFIEGGIEYKWVGPQSSELHLDFNTWQVWEAIPAEGEDDNIPSYYFVVDPEDGFIDWGPCDTLEEAKEFLDSKVSDYEDDDDDIYESAKSGKNFLVQVVTDKDKVIGESWSKTTNEMIDAIDNAQFLLNNETINEFDSILKSCGANEDDSDPDLGYFAGMSDEQIKDAYNQVKELVKRVIKGMSPVDINNRFFGASEGGRDILNAFDIELNHKGELIESANKLTENIDPDSEDFVYKREAAEELIDDLEQLLRSAIDKLNSIERIFKEIGIHSADIPGYFTNYIDNFIDSYSGEMSCTELRDRLEEYVNEGV